MWRWGLVTSMLPAASSAAVFAAERMHRRRNLLAGYRMSTCQGRTRGRVAHVTRWQ
ncbi:exported hypothetical protein [Xanthomonas citri pv. citri]|nr:exported hypothetical protein [Xanthomonas citri pv. citri]CEE66134.1 exported hypothetical protein [Xanthomonas citri pv. citri]CEH57130.1 exported hypothetical protein [Xanthomonas citri pv. citri]CEH71417.1 exported hypothetical protein [Xanthomonas citri pv. citri]CEH74101.1 exported hypothetical protein [Xanthomonas citri pv. citri]